MPKQKEPEAKAASSASRLKLIIVLAIVKPAIATGAALLRDRDANSTGIDDEVAGLMEHFLTRLTAYEKDPDAPGANDPGSTDGPVV